MPTTARITVFSADALSSTQDNVDSVVQTENSRHEHWSISGGGAPVRFYWPLEGEMNLFLQLWQPQPALNETTFKIAFPAASTWLGWECVVPVVGKVMLLLRKPAATDILEVTADQFSVEADVIYF